MQRLTQTAVWFFELLAVGLALMRISRALNMEAATGAEGARTQNA